MSRYGADYPSMGHNTPKADIREVWAYNLEEEMRNLQMALEKHKYVAMDTEFPGEVAQPIGTFRSRKDKYYQTLRCNVDLLNIIQLGVTLFDEANNGPSRGACTWQFNFRFTLEEEMFAVSSIDLLKNAGIDFQQLSKDGIDVADFGYYLIASGLVFNDSVKWIR